MTATDSAPVSSVSRRRGSAGRVLALLVALVFAVALVVFVLQNTVHETVNVLGWNFDLPQGVWLLGAAVVGSVITVAVTSALRIRRAVR